MTQNLESDNLSVKQTNLCQVQRNDYKFYQKFPYVNDMGGMSSVLLDKLSAEIWSWCSQRNIFITAQFLPGIQNFDADHMSRNFTDN
jgi:hypothetical protein